MNRGIARRTIFERPADYRYFLSRLGRSVRRGDIEVHAHSLLGNHYHILLRSLLGRLSESMRRIQNEYVRYFNRSRRRDGPLFRGRFVSRRVRDPDYRRLLVSYIDDNPIDAGLVASASDWRWGSARFHSTATAPQWLENSWLDGELATSPTDEAGRRERYAAAFPSRLDLGFRAWIERNLARCPGVICPWDEGVAVPGPKVRAWMIRKAALADGTTPFVPILYPEIVEQELRDRRAGPLTLAHDPLCKLDTWELLRVALLRDACGLRYDAITARTGLSASAAARRVAVHRSEIAAGGREYTDQMSCVLDACLVALRPRRRSVER